MQDVNSNEPGRGLFRRTWVEWLSSLPVFLLLLLTLIIGTGEMIHGQLLRLGETLYGSPQTGVQYSFLRADPVAPQCDRNPNIDALVQQKMAAGSASDDPFADLFGPQDPESVRQSILAAQSVCEEKYQFYESTHKYIEAHPSVKAYRTFETAFFAVFRFGTENRSLILVLLFTIAAITATHGYHHVSLRPAATRLDYKVQSAAMVLGNLLLFISAVSYYFSQQRSGIAVTETSAILITYLWIFLFGFLTLMSVYQFFKTPAPTREGGSFGLALLSIPLYAYMAISTGITFTFFLDYAVGQAIYLGNLVEYSNLFLSLALFIWAGMLLKQTRVVDLFLDILRPWNFSPETLTWLILLAAALPTAYTGASGIFVIAAGAIIYKEVWNSGARRQYALAATAMSGTLGVVLKPCLLIVVIASLNRQVTTDMLYHYGVYVFLLTSTLFLIISLFLAPNKFRIAPPSVAIPNSLRALVPVSPYVVIGGLVIWGYSYLLNTQLNEFTAPVIMPIILLAIVLFDKIRREQKPVAAASAGSMDEQYHSPYLREQELQGVERRTGFEGAVRSATNETTGHIGALIMLMGLTVSVGGLFERMEIMSLIPTDLGSILFAITGLLCILVLVGMFMDPFGAIILVSATVAPVAYANGIDPVHFWMIVLISFELAYLLPPVALNQLLTRMVVGEKEMAEADDEVKDKNFYYRYERWILPIIVMFPALLIVAYIPYFFKLFGWY
jgi:TRAP-type C4-dicarboxylate transport system permease large subunit